MVREARSSSGGFVRASSLGRVDASTSVPRVPGDDRRVPALRGGTSRPLASVVGLVERRSSARSVMSGSGGPPSAKTFNTRVLTMATAGRQGRRPLPEPGTFVICCGAFRHGCCYQSENGPNPPRPSFTPPRLPVARRYYRLRPICKQKDFDGTVHFFVLTMGSTSCERFRLR